MLKITYLTKILVILIAISANAEEPKNYLFEGEEKFLKNVRMLTHGGENAEAYFSPNGDWIVWQGRRDGNYPADQIWVMSLTELKPKMISTGFGKTTCGFFIPGTERVVFSSTHGHSKEPPPPVDFREGYVWNLDEYDAYTVNRDGSDMRRLTDSPGYDAETAISPDGKTILFTSMRNGDLDIYSMDIDGKNVKQLTNTLGYDGGAFFSPDGEWIVFRAHHPKTDEEIAKYTDLMSKRKVSPIRFEVFVMRPDGSDRRQVTDLGVASFAPYMHPDGKRIIFCSNHGGDKGARMPEFNLFMINVDGTGLTKITNSPTFDGFPMFSNDGKKFIWSSNRHAPEHGSTNIFIADWID